MGGFRNKGDNRGQIRLTTPADTICANVGQYYQMQGVFDNGDAKNFSVAADGTMTCLKSGTYLLSGASDLQVDKASEITYALYVNGVLNPDAQTPHTFSATSKIDNIAITALVPLNYGDQITVRMKSDTITTTVTVNTLFVTTWGGV